MIKDITGYEGLYQITDDGKVWSLISKKYLKPGATGRGYLSVILCKDGIKKPHQVHRLVAEAFLPNPDNLPQVNHIDECKTNNCVSNLMWVSAVDNANYGTRNSRIAKKICQYSLTGEYIQSFNSLTEASQAIGKHLNGISGCLRGRQKTCGGYVWKYQEGGRNEC